MTQIWVQFKNSTGEKVERIFRFKHTKTVFEVSVLDDSLITQETFISSEKLDLFEDVFEYMNTLGEINSWKELKPERISPDFTVWFRENFGSMEIPDRSSTKKKNPNSKN